MPTLLNKKKISPSFGSKIFGLKLEKSAKIFCLKIGRNFFLLCKVGMGNKLYLIKIFHLLLKKFRLLSDFTFESEVLWFFSQGLQKRIFLDWLVKLHDNSFYNLFRQHFGKLSLRKKREKKPMTLIVPKFDSLYFRARNFPFSETQNEQSGKRAALIFEKFDSLYFRF